MAASRQQDRDAVGAAADLAAEGAVQVAQAAVDLVRAGEGGEGGGGARPGGHLVLEGVRGRGRGGHDVTAFAGSGKDDRLC